MRTDRPNPPVRIKRLAWLLAISAASFAGCDSPDKTYTFHDLISIDQRHQERINTAANRPDWYYTGTADGNHVLLLRSGNRKVEKEFLIPEDELHIDQTFDHTDDRTHWRKINHRIRTIIR